MSVDREPEDLAALAALAALDRHAAADTADSSAIAGRGVSDATRPGVEAPDDAASEVLERLYLETVGLLAYELDPVAPPPGLRENLLANLSGDDTQDVSPLLAPQMVVPSEPLRPAAPVEAPRRPEALPAPPAPVRSARARSGEIPLREPGVSRRRASRWPSVLAALFALAAIGLGVWVAMLDSEVAYRDAQIRRLEEALARSGELERELTEAKQELQALEERYTFVTSPATTVFALRPPAGGSPQPLARGHLFLAANQRDWRLEVRGLATEPETQDYQLWFIVDGLPMSAGVFDATRGKTAFLADRAMPENVVAVAITLERKGGAPAPTTPILLIADSSVRL